jgi:S-DNA-T family DNA segregation ATPase FtsK/SpoIIIE
MSKKVIPPSGSREVIEVAKIIQKTFADFDVKTEIVEATEGLRFYHCYFRTIKPVRMKTFATFANDLKYALETTEVEIEAPVLGKKLIGVKIPKQQGVTSIAWKSYLNYNHPQSPLTIPIGRDEFGEDKFADIATFPHLLIGGMSNVGKSNFLKSTISYLINQHNSETLRLLLVDPKRSDFTSFKTLPHLLAPVITEPKKTLMMLKWCVKEMERRYDILESFQCKDLSEYHQTIYQPNNAVWVAAGSPEETIATLPEPLPYVVVVFDEIADLMYAYPQESEASLVRLAQMSRAAGIHMIISTQRPSANVVTGSLKANIPARLAFATPSTVDSRTILDLPGAEKLHHPGDGLWLSTTGSEPVFVQTPLVREDDIAEQVAYWHKVCQEARANSAMTSDTHQGFDDSVDEDEDDDMYEEAKAMVLKYRKASTSLLQRTLHVGYSRSARLIDLLENRGVIGPANGTKPRQIFE